MRTIYPKPDIGVDWKEYFNLLREEIGIQKVQISLVRGGVCDVVRETLEYASRNGYKLKSEFKLGASVREALGYLKDEGLRSEFMLRSREITATHKIIIEGYIDHILKNCDGEEPEFYGLAMALHSMLFEGVRPRDGYSMLLKLDTIDEVNGNDEYGVLVSVSDNNLRLVEAGDMSCFEEGLMPLPLTPECLLMVEGIEGLLSKK